MSQSYDINEVPPDEETICVKSETERAKQYLQKYCPEIGESLYDHLTEVLSKILAERPKNAFTSFGEYSKKLLDDKYRPQNDHLQDLYVPPAQYEDAKKLIKLFKVQLPIEDDNQSMEDENDENSEAVEKIIPNIFDLIHYTEKADIGLPRAEMVLLNLTIRKLIIDKKIEDVRFWGKILGRQKNYYILEANLPELEVERRLQEEAEKGEINDEKRESVSASEGEKVDAEKIALESAMATKLVDSDGENKTESEEKLELVFPPTPESTWKPLPQVLPEKLGTGVNAKVYFVCNSPGLDNWVELPTVTPQQIVIARQMMHLFTGNLETKIHSFPPFPGKEKNYLRAQIARIGAATHVSPIGYFTLGKAGQEDDEMEEEEENEGEEEEVDEEEGNDLVKNKRYASLPIKDLIDPSMSNWCHHSPFLLKQGRIEWQDPGKINDDNKSEEEDEDENEDENTENEDEEGSEEGEEIEEKDKGYKKEIGPPLLTPLSEDAASDSVTPWSTRLSSNVQPDTAVALIRSNIWPGAFAFAVEKKFFNLYIGWGHKQNAFNYSPSAMPALQDQYAMDSELVEIRDPSFEEEEAYRIARLASENAQLDEEEESEETESTENDDED